MNNGYELSAEHPKKNASLLSKAFQGWLIPLVKLGKNKRLELKDIYKNLDENQSDKLTILLEKHWKDELVRAKTKNVQPSLLRAVLKIQQIGLWRTGMIWIILYLFLLITRPIIISELLSTLSETKRDRTVAMYCYATALIVNNFISIFFNFISNFELLTIGMRTRVAISSLIYRKITKLDQSVLAETAVGQIVNLLSNEVQRFDNVFIFCHVFWMMPIQLVLITYIVYNQVGLSSLVGVFSVIIITFPVQGILAKIMLQFRIRITNKTDHRIKLMSEVVSGIRVIKMYAWEKPFHTLIKLARKSETNDSIVRLYCRGVYTNYALFVDKLGLCATVVCYVSLGYSLTAAKVFSITQCFALILWTIGNLYPFALNTGTEALVTLKRIQKFLMQEEKSHNLKELNMDHVVLSKVEASWTKGGFTLKDIDMQIPSGCLCVIVGPVGAGKSSILQLLLGELHTTSGTIQIGRNVSYSSQKPWIFYSTVRSNILFGKPYEKSWYDKVVNACALEKDFEQFPHGDQTVVGEKGVSLSGGQQARINLARAIYRKNDIYLLDDPLSAVDTHVGKHLFEQCIMHHLRGKTRILVTHQIQYLKNADLIVVINNGRIEAQGTLEKLSHSTKDFTKTLTKPGDENEKEEAQIVNSENTDVLKDDVTNDVESEKIGTIDEEQCGDKKCSPYKEYFYKNANIYLAISTGIFFIWTQTANVSLDLWITYWTSQEELRSFLEKNPGELKLKGVNNTISNCTYSIWDNLFEYIQFNGESTSLLKTDFAKYFYIGLFTTFIILMFVRSMLFIKSCMISANSIHSKVFEGLLIAPMRFFDRNPSGRILNIFSKDMGAIDETLPIVFLEAAQIVLITVGSIITICITTPYMTIACAIMVFVFFIIKVLYSSTAKALKHLEGIGISPLFSHVNLTLSGINTIRAAKAEEILIKEFDQHQDVHTSITYLIISCLSGFSFWLDIAVIVFLACVTFGSISISDNSYMSGSLVGLAICQCIYLSGRLQYGLRQTGEVMNNITSVERVLQYTRMVQEGPFDTPKGAIASNWPEKAAIEFKNLILKYGEKDPLVLKGLNFSITPGQKIGVVGRTGAGKSSLIAALFRLAPLEGSIFIDGIDTKQLGLADLRKKLSIIPQEPVLFTETLRYNLDPFKEYGDDRIWDALEQVELKGAVASLDMVVTEGGGNFSIGQRQLVCLARAILKNNKILIMDEATANVDHRTDSLIQATIRRNFKDCTVLTIAHRLDTIMDSDKVIVMSFGEIVEFDSPYKLLQIPNGHFLKLVLETGQSISMADTSYLNNVNQEKSSNK